MTYEIPVLIGLWAWLWAYVLTSEGELLAPVDLAAQRLLKPDKAAWRNAIYKPLIGCPKCHANLVAVIWQIVSLSYQPITVTALGSAVAFWIVAVSTAEILVRWLK
jgi:hypothetical protein